MRADSEFLPLYKSFQESVLRFTEVLVLFVASCPQSVTIEEIVRRTQRNIDDLHEVINSLQQLDLIKPHHAQSDRWILACNPSEVTLESVLTCAISKLDFGPLWPSSQLSGVDALLVPAFMSVTQTVLNTLRQFSLDRVPRTMRSSLNQIARKYHFS